MDELAKRFADLAEKYGPSVVDAAVRAASIEGYSTLVSSLIWIGLAAFFGWGAKQLSKYITKDEDLQFVPKVGAGILLFLTALTLAGGIWCVLDPWTWTAINHPELYIAKRAMKL